MVQILQRNMTKVKLAMVTEACHPSTWEVWARRSAVRGQPVLLKTQSQKWVKGVVKPPSLSQLPDHAQ